ncbi:MmcQ/YjbR family DNA-binding protein [Aeromicrobium sp. Root472D3]|uniref:MmcQ/YjbR family DNA-binding protein n=1 Tax=Aeromicrobium sp. Root472D3 TaxID=1736540 RepID=UPI0006F495F4|nr:MmcQ/YjbR family DNA-binding protein [Aeromicrobium sp. Root472D3]KQX74835.1 hypothetical protein ASD10_06390 [Aeromicrobium sp. Root472D3]
MAVTWDEVVHFACTLPDVAASTSYGTPALKVDGRLLTRLRTSPADGGAGEVVLRCSLDDKAALVDGDDPAFSTTSHYDGHGSVLVDLGRVDRDELFELVDSGWYVVAPPAVRARRDA